jgi:hypothetical protein
LNLRDDPAPVLETPFGILAHGGHWYFISREQIDEYAPGLLKIHTLEKLLRIADRWIQSSASISLLVFILLSFLNFEPYLSFTGGVLAFFSWSSLKSGFITQASSYIINLLGSTPFIYLSIGLYLSWLGMQGRHAEVILGLILFFITKFPLLKTIRDRINIRLSGSSYVSEEDRVFKMILIRFSMAEGILTREVRDLEQQLFDLIHYNRKNKK